MEATHPCVCDGGTCIRAGAVNACGEGLEFELEFRADRVTRVSFSTDACWYTACACCCSSAGVCSATFFCCTWALWHSTQRWSTTACTWAKL
ncbi:MAG TPA: hypothetical protein P5076_24205, partial [Myxococcota bacterium]|nr:hypothetical protein [Myxococcota bacterium]